MFYDDRSDFGAMIAGTVFMLVSLLLTGLIALRNGFDIDMGIDGQPMGVVFVVVGVLGLIISGFAMYKGFFTDGVMFAAVACMMIFYNPSLIMAIVFAVVFLLIAVMCYLEGQKDLAALNVILTATVILMKSTDSDTCTGIGGIVMLVAAVLVLIMGFMMWRDIQDYTAEIEDGYFEDDCCCEDECHCGECEGEKKE